MNLADELKGLKPHKTVEGRIVNNDDPPEIEDLKPRSQMLCRVRDFVARVRGEFTAHDIVFACGIKRKIVAEYLCRLKKQGLIKRVGFVRVGKSAYLNLWRKC